MLKIEKAVLPSPEQWEIIIEGMRNPMNSWGNMDSLVDADFETDWNTCSYHIGANDMDLMKRLAKGGPVHAKYRRMIPVFLTINAPLYWWKEFDTYKIGTVANSCSTMHKIHSKEFTLDDFSSEHLIFTAADHLKRTISAMNEYRQMFLNFDHEEYAVKKAFDNDKKSAWWQMIQLLPTSFNQKRTVMLNYEVLCNIYHSRRKHKLDEWIHFCSWIKTLPYSELITGGAIE